MLHFAGLKVLGISVVQPLEYYNNNLNATVAVECVKRPTEFACRLKVKACIIGYARVYGNYATHPADKLMMDIMDIMYIEKNKIVLDINLILLMIRALFMTDKTRGNTERAEKLMNSVQEVQT